MAWNGLYVYDGTEIINAEATEAYLKNEPWFTPLPELRTEQGTVYEMRTGNVGTYTSPAVDAAPWIDPDEPISGEFFGVYPLDISGIDTSVRTSNPFETTGNGGTPGKIRHGIRTLVFQVALCAGSDEAAGYGMRWLRRALLGAAGSSDLTTNVATGLSLDYLDIKPEFDVDSGRSALERVATLERHLRKVTINSGPTEPVRRRLSCGSAVWITTFTAVVGNPFEIGRTREILTNMPNSVDYVGDATPGIASGPTTYAEVNCGSAIFDPLYDPLCSPFAQPPQPPTVPIGCYNTPATWARYQASIDKNDIPLWGQVVPTVELYTSVIQRGIRIRFYQDLDNDRNTADDPCNFVGDMLVSYIPAGATLILDGVNEEIRVLLANGQNRRADSLAFGSDYKPFAWPSLTFGQGYVMVADFDDTGGAVARPNISLSLTPRVV